MPRQEHVAHRQNIEYRVRFRYLQRYLLFGVKIPTSESKTAAYNRSEIGQMIIDREYFFNARKCLFVLCSDRPAP